MAEHARDFFQLNRLKAFNDAVFSIVATILVLPIRKLEDNSKSLEDELDSRSVQITVYFVAFLVICAVWESHVLRFKILSHVDDVLVWLNLTSLMFTSFLPFVCALEGKYAEKKTPMILICADLFIIELLEVIMILYSFRDEALLTEELLDLPEEQKKERRDFFLVKKLTNPLLYILAACLSLVNVTTSWVLLGVVMITPCLNRLLGLFYRRLMAIRMRNSEFDHMFGNYIDTERVECFSDGLFAIVLTLLVLDITTEDFPKESKVDSDGLVKTILGMWPELLTYTGTFVAVSLLWFVHHSLFHHIKSMNQFMLVCNNISLACIGLSPLIVAILNRYADDTSELNSDERLAVQFSSITVFVASIMQAMVFVIALCKGPSHLDRQINPSISSQNHNYLATKLIVIPLVSCVVYGSSFSSFTASFVVYHTAILAAPFLFIALKICFGRGGYNYMKQEIVIDPDIETWVPPPPQSRSRVPRRGRGPLPQSIAV